MYVCTSYIINYNTIPGIQGFRMSFDIFPSCPKQVARAEVVAISSSTAPSQCQEMLESSATALVHETLLSFDPAMSQ